MHLFEKVIKVEKVNSLFEIATSKSNYTGLNVIIATGFYDIPNKLNIPGEELDKVSHYYNDPHFYAQQKIAVVGASNSAIDAALECYRKGANVSLIIRGTEVGQRVKYWVRPDIINRIEEGSIKVFYNSTLKEIKPHEILINTPEGVITIENDYVLALIGYKPNFEFLEHLGITLTEDEKRLPTYNQATMETNVSNLYLAGVICGGMETHKWFIENSRIHAKMIIESILEKRK